MAHYLQFHPEDKGKCLVLNPCVTDDEIVEQVIRSKPELFGMTDLYSNHGRCVQLARLVKEDSPSTKIVLGGPNASALAKLILQNHSYVDFVAVGSDGKETLRGLAEGWDVGDIPNLYFREGDNAIKFSWRRPPEINSVIWILDNFQDVQKRLPPKNQKLTEGVQLSFSGAYGCPKANGLVGNRKGACSFCSAFPACYTIQSPKMYWKQVEYLSQFADILWDVQDALTGKMAAVLAQRRLSKTLAYLRVYIYLPEFLKHLDAELFQLGEVFAKLGVIDVLPGIDHFHPAIAKIANKDWMSPEQAAHTLNMIFKGSGGITRFTPALITLLPGETKETLAENVRACKNFLVLTSHAHNKRFYLARCPIAVAGSRINSILRQNMEVCEKYKSITGRVLAIDDNPNYSILDDLLLEYYTQITRKEANEAYNLMKMFAQKYGIEFFGDFPLPKNISICH